MPRRTTFLLLATALLLMLAGLCYAQTGGRGVAEILAGRDLSDPAQRAEAVAEVQALEEGRKAAAVARAQERGLPVRVERPDGTVQEMMGFCDILLSGSSLKLSNRVSL